MTATATSTRGRWIAGQVAVAALLAAMVALGIWIVVDGHGARAAAQPDATYTVAPGRLAVVAPAWRSSAGRWQLAVPAQAVAYFPEGTSAPPEAEIGTGRYVVQVLHFDAVATRRADAAAVPGADGPPLRWRVEVRSVQVDDPGTGFVGIVGVAPNDFVVAHYQWVVGTGDVVSAAPPASTELDPPLAQPDVPVVVRAVRGSTAVVRVETTEPGWHGTLRRADGVLADLHVSRDGRALEANVPLRLIADPHLVARIERPTVNVGWVRVFDARDRLVIDVAARL